MSLDLSDCFGSPPHENFNIKLHHFANATAVTAIQGDAGVGGGGGGGGGVCAIALPVHS